MRLLRDRSLSSRILILLEVRRRPPSTLRPLAEAVGITEQAVSGYLRQLAKEGLTVRKGKTWRITPEGEDVLREHVKELKAFADGIVRDLVMVESCSAIAGAAIKAGDKVALVMDKGRLVARPGKRSTSSGVAQTDAEEGADVTVGLLRGIVKIQQASLTVIDVPGSKEGGSSALQRGWLRKRLETLSPSHVAALDEAGEGALRGAGAGGRLEFAPLHNAVAAVARGVSPVYVGSPESVGYLLADIEIAKADGKAAHLRYDLEKAPRKKAVGGRRRG